MKVAIAHDYLTQRGGAEKVVLALAKEFPGSPIYTTLYEPSGTYAAFESLDIRPSFLNRSSYLRKNHRAALPILPVASNSIKIDADVVIASSSGWSHGFRASGRTLVYCYSPARWLYSSERYLGEQSSAVMKVGLAVSKPALTAWDKYWAGRADSYLAISTEVQDRIRNTYGRDSTVVPAPHSVNPNTRKSRPAGIAVDVDEPGFYLCISRLLPYKNVDKVVDAFRGSERNLVIVGSGPSEDSIRKSLPSNVTMLSRLTDSEMAWLYAQCAAVVSASYEDFGLTPIEAATYGKPSAVLRWGGFLDTINEGVTGVYFDKPNGHEISRALTELEATNWDPNVIAAHADTYSEEKFSSSIRQAVEALH